MPWACTAERLSLHCPEPAAALVRAPRTTVHCCRAPTHINPGPYRALLCPYRTTGPQPWFVPLVAIVTGPGSDSLPLRETVQALPRLQMLTLWTKLQRHHLHWPLLLYQRRLRILSSHPGDIRPEWDLGPLL